ncbi:RluA family pseudouridine synthase [Cryomorphaceae bacterium]|nr:RluA family pseudouridine synthase [Cryomorphaceae bacterium]
MEPMRLQEYGVGLFEECATKSAWKKAIKARKVLLNGVEASTARLVHTGDEITLLGVPDVPPGTIFEMDIPVLYEDDFLAVVHKPVGISVSGNRRRTLMNALPPNLQPSTQRDACSPRTIHRLDYETSGALLAGKTRSAVQALSEMFAHRKVHKTYYAIVLGTPPDHGTFDRPIQDKPARSYFERLASTPSERFGSLSLLRLTPETGRRHQLRIHLSEAGHPILGDRKYCKPDQLLTGKGMYLHAFSLAFEHPVSGDEVLVQADPHKKYAKIFPFVPWES